MDRTILPDLDQAGNRQTFHISIYRVSNNDWFLVLRGGLWIAVHLLHPRQSWQSDACPDAEVEKGHTRYGSSAEMRRFLTQLIVLLVGAP